MSSGPTAPQDDGPKLQQLVEQLAEAAKGYDPSPGAAGYVSRTNVSQVAKEIVRLMMAPSHMAMQHATNVGQSTSCMTSIQLTLPAHRALKSWP